VFALVRDSAWIRQVRVRRIPWRSQRRYARLRDPNVRAESAHRRNEEGKKGLCRPDGSKLYSGEVHGEEFKKLARGRNGALTERRSWLWHRR
jgi:hypothetical protein